jgi:micrococcal nuclease
VVDGDTVALDIDLGFRLWFSTKARLAGINAPERRTAAGKASKQHLEQLILEWPPQIVRTTINHEFEKYGRVLATLFYAGVNLNAKMVEDGFAVAVKES